VTHFSSAVRLRPSFCDAWLMLAPLLVEQNQLTAAAAAAEHAAEADPRRLEARIAEAYTSYRLGLVTRAESLFTSTIPQLDRMMRDRFEDIAPVASERDTAVLRRLPAARKAAFVRDFWKEHDPDLATPENEAQLEYWSRVSHAYFIYWDAHRRAWDERGELYVRYGRPDVADYNPVNAKLYVVSPLGRPFPANILMWAWPHLGMNVTLQDRLLSEYYQLPISLDHDMDPRPDPDSLSRDREILASRGGRGVFPLLPPGVTRRPIAGVVARFAGGASARLLAQLATPAGPGDSLTAEWVVLDSAQAEVARARRALVPSACDPTEDQVADFATELPAGRYMVGMTVRDRDGGRGVYRAPVTIGPAGDELRLSDVVVACGLDPGIGSGSAPPAVRIEPNPSARVKGSDPLTAYFEIYHLSPGADGRARFEYVYTVSSAARDTRNWFLRTLQPRPQPPPISASRIETQAGDLRRQFVRVPVESFPPGRYRLEITVRDLVAGTEARRGAPFERVSEPPAARD
jgi:GWxTD domain-containing protein